MGKTDFVTTHYQAICNELYQGRAPTLKISHFSDPYEPGKNYAVVNMYHWKGKSTWHNPKLGFDGRFLYVAFSCTDNWDGRFFQRAGQGMVHDHIFKETFGESYSSGQASCGGGAVHQGRLKFSSAWLNCAQSTSTSPYSATTDGSKYMTNEERHLLTFAARMWVEKGRNSTHKIPEDLHKSLMGTGAPLDDVNKDGVDITRLQDRNVFSFQPDRAEKTGKPCKYFFETGECRFGDNCRYSHSQRKLDKDAGKPCKYIRKTGTCPFGDQCRFNHNVAQCR